MSGLALAMSAGVVSATLWFCLPWLYPDALLDDRVASARLAGSRFHLVSGASSSVDGTALVITGLRNGRASFQTKTFFAADRYPFMRLDLSGVHPELKVLFLWRSPSPNSPWHMIGLERGSEAVTWHLLSAAPGWHDQIADVAIGVFGRRAFEPIRLESVSFEPATRAALARLVWQDWRLFAPWSQSAANNYSGVRPGAVLHPVAVVNLWLLGTLLLMAGFARWRRLTFSSWWPAAVAVVLVSWLLVDGLWQLRLADQVSATQVRYGGLDQAGKRAREDDADLQVQARALQDEIAPVRGKRLFLLHDSVGHEFNRLRLQYHLLPLNVYNFGAELPAPRVGRAGDLVLLLDRPRHLRFDRIDGVLDDGHTRWAAELVMEQPRFALFRLQESARAR